MAWEWDEVPALVERFGPEAVGRLYATRCRGALTAAEGAPHAARDEHEDPFGWVEDAVSYGEGIDAEVRFAMVVAAIEEAGSDEDVLWRIGDMPVEHLAVVPGIKRRFQLARATSPSVDRLFRVMQAYYRNVWGRPDAGWWDGDPTSAPA